MTLPQHDRTLFHSGVEDATTLTLSAQIGRYPQGMTAQAVLEDLASRLSFIEAAGPNTIVKALTLDAYIFAARSLTLDAVITTPIHTFTLNADIAGTQSRSLTLNAYFLDHVGGQTTLVGNITSSTSPITVSSTASFPFSGSFVIQIDSEQMLVTGGQGTTTWTVTRGINGTIATSHTSGAAVSEIC